MPPLSEDYLRADPLYRRAANTNTRRKPLPLRSPVNGPIHPTLSAVAWALITTGAALGAIWVVQLHL